MLFKTIQEVQGFIPINGSLSFDLLAPHIEIAEGDWLHKLLGTDLTAKLQQDYDNASIDEKHLALLKKARRAAAMLGMSLYAPFGQVQISDAGWRTIQNDNERAAFKWQVKDIEQALLIQGFKALEDLAAFLERNKSDYPEWDYAGAHQYTLNTAIEFDSHVNINASRLIYLKLLPHISRAEKNIASMIGKALMKELLTAVAAGNLSEDMQALLEKVQPAVAHAAFAKAIPALPVEIEGNRLLIFSNQFISDFDPKAVPDAGILAYQSRINREAADQYEAELFDFLNENVGDYPAFIESSAYVLPEADEIDFSEEDTGGWGCF